MANSVVEGGENMMYFNVKFTLANGESKVFHKYEAKSYNSVANQVTESGWFGVKGDLVNLSNVIRCRILEVDENGYQITNN